MHKNQALLIIDVQNDFCPQGALPVKNGDEVVPVLNEYIKIFKKKGLPILASRDWHPVKTTHFKEFGGLWPAHCVADTQGAAFHPDLQLPDDMILVTKGTDPQKDSYSAFHGQTKEGADLNGFLKEAGIKELYVGGLATDYCVMSSCLDARMYGFDVYLLVDAIKGVNLKPQDAHNAIEKMHTQSVKDMDVKRMAQQMKRS